MAIRITESQLRKIVRQEASRLLEVSHRRGGLAPRIKSMEDAAKVILSGHPGGYEDACEFLARMFKGSPTPSMDIAMALEDLGVDGDTAFEVGDTCEMNYM